MAGETPAMGAVAWRALRPFEVGACGRAAFPGRTKRWPSPQPFPPAGEGARRHAARSSGADEPKAEPSDGPSGRYLPSGRAEKRRAWGGRGSAACRASCSDSLRLSERSAQARSEFLSDAPRPSIAGCPQRSGGTRPAGSPFSLVTFFLARQKESDCAAGRTSRPATHPTPQPLTSTLSPKGRGSIRAARQVHGKNRPRSYQHPQATPLANIASFAGRRRSLSSST